jgi:hypothetical protein
MTEFDVPTLLDEAKAATGLSDWGDAQGCGLDTFRPALEIQARTLEAQTDLSPASRAAIRSKLVRLLSNRLKLVQDRKGYPQIAEAKVTQPIIVLGLARTGSTLIHGLLAADPKALVPEYWECELPSSPPPGLAAPDDPRIAVVSRELEAMIATNPLVAAQHPYYVTQGVHIQAECGHVLEATFASVFNWAYFGSTDEYLELLFDRDYARTCMDFHRMFLQHLSVGRPEGRWTLKAPEHVKHLDAVLEAYPDACIIWTHRKLMQVLPSIASVSGIVRAVNHDIDKRSVAREALDFNKRQLDEGLAARRKAAPGRIYDLHYERLMADPEGEVRAIYDHFGLAFTPEHAAGMQRYLAQNPHSAAGAHQYTLAGLGLEEGALRAQFSDYAEAVGL